MGPRRGTGPRRGWERGRGVERGRGWGIFPRPQPATLPSLGMDDNIIIISHDSIYFLFNFRFLVRYQLFFMINNWSSLSRIATQYLFDLF